MIARSLINTAIKLSYASFSTIYSQSITIIDTRLAAAVTIRIRISGAPFDNATITSTYSTSEMAMEESSQRAFENVPRSALYDSISETIGRTPIVKLKHMSPKEGVDVFVKLESENPGGSVKDRLAMGVIEWAEKHGELKPGQTDVCVCAYVCVCTNTWLYSFRFVSFGEKGYFTRA